MPKNPFPLPPDLTGPEEDLIAKAKAGEECILGATRPEKDDRTAQNTIRAEVIQHLALGGDPDDPVHPKGVQLTGAWIDGALDFESVRLTRPLLLFKCHIAAAPSFLHAHAPLIGLDGSWVPWLNADSLTTEGPVYLCKGFKAAGTVILRNARIGGQLACEDGEFLGGETALNLEKARVAGDWFWRRITLARGAVDLKAAQVEHVLHDGQSWPERGKLHLESFVYAGFGNSPGGFARLKDWLGRQPEAHLGRDFRPQPFEHLAKVLRETGHTEDAKRVSMLKQRYMRRVAWMQAYSDIFGNGETGPKAIAKAAVQAPIRFLRELGKWLFSIVALDWMVGYGYRPFRAVLWALVIIACGNAVFDAARVAGAMVPNNPGLLRKDWPLAVEGIALAPGSESATSAACQRGDPYTCFYQSVPDYQRFDPLVYAIDTFVPIVNLDQATNWIPQPEGKEGAWPWLRLYLWIHIALGWIVTAVFAAAITGVVKKDV